MVDSAFQGLRGTVLGTVGAAQQREFDRDSYDRRHSTLPDQVRAGRSPDRLSVRTASDLAGAASRDPRGEQEKPENEPETLADDHGRTAFYLANNSPEPVYPVVGGMVFVQGAGPHALEEMLDLNHKQYGRRGPATTVSILPGGLYLVWIDGTGWHRILSGRAGVEIAFSDAAGAHWIRRATGRLDELPKPPLEYFHEWHLYGPHDFQIPERVPST